jgi:flavin reductase (DIM6/NTAB) family NADH-FMN oxidoreductase RutF
MDSLGRLNLAPFSYFTVAANDPLTLLFCPQVSMRSGQPKDTFANVQAVPEFVINLVNEELAEAMNQTAAELPPGQSEFEWAGVTPAPAETIRVPRVAEAPVAFECTLYQIVSLDNHPGGGAVVFGRVQCIHVRDDLLEAGRLKLAAFRPIGRLGGSSYVRVTDTFDMQRPTHLASGRR